jgi:hypothetical protein
MRSLGYSELDFAVAGDDKERQLRNRFLQDFHWRVRSYKRKQSSFKHIGFIDKSQARSFQVRQGMIFYQRTNLRARVRFAACSDVWRWAPLHSFFMITAEDKRGERGGIESALSIEPASMTSFMIGEKARSQHLLPSFRRQYILRNEPKRMPNNIEANRLDQGS